MSEPFRLTAAPVQQGLFSPTSFEKKPEPKAPVVEDKRQQSMFATEAKEDDKP